VVGNLAATSLRLGLLFLVGREVAAHLGSEGIVVMGQLQNLMGLGLALPSLALNSGIQQALGSATGSQVPDRSSWALLSGQALAVVSALVVTGLVLTGSVYLPEVVGREGPSDPEVGVLGVSNARNEPVTVDLAQDGLWGDVRMVAQSITGERVSADRIEWKVPVPANGSTELTATFDTRY